MPTLDDAAPLAQAPPFADMFGFDGTMLMARQSQQQGGRGGQPAKIQQAITVDSADVGKILGFRGATQQAMEARTGAHIFVQNIDGADTDRIIVEGDDESVKKGVELVQGVLEKGAEAFELPSGRRQPNKKVEAEA